MVKVSSTCCIVSNFYIKSQHPDIDFDPNACCIVSNFYIKSQLLVDDSEVDPGCIVSNFYIKSQHPDIDFDPNACCIVSNFYIKSQRPDISAFAF